MKIFINEKKFNATEGETIIQLADREGIHIPRFCYHKHLSVVASCRMCLVDIEGVKHAQPACSTPLREDMKIHTNSQKTKIAQKSSMEFLLINHPLDCPICDQGGECELQDISLEYGDSHSKYMQLKRVVIDKDISPLISTDMTRCIHCSRCVRFGEEISNVKELGLLNRGEEMKIDSFIEKSVTSELSGNMIDLCPVGALNNKPYRYKARTWDLKQHGAISPHDCIGSNIFYHTYNNRIIRAVPKENQDINQTWLSDRDRFGYEGIYSDDRVKFPMIKRNGKLVECELQTILENTKELIDKSMEDYGPDNIGCLISAQSSSEELFLFQKLLREIGLSNIDHRTNECDFLYQNDYPSMPSLGCNLDELSSFDDIVLVGVNIKSEFPILSIRLNHATKDNVKIHSINFDSLAEDFPLTSKLLSTSANLPMVANSLIKNISSNSNSKTLIIIGPRISHLTTQSNFYSTIYKNHISDNISIGFLTDYCNSTSAWLLGNVPHRLSGGSPAKSIGLNAYKMLKEKLQTYILYNLDPEYDFWDSELMANSLSMSKCNIFFSSYMTPMIEKYADIVIPITTYAETKGSYINIEGTYQVFDKIVNPADDILDGWFALNELLKKYKKISYSFDDIRSQIIKTISGVDFRMHNLGNTDYDKPVVQDSDVFVTSRRPTYNSDIIVRRSPSLQSTRQSKNNQMYISDNLAKAYKDNDYVVFENFNVKYKLEDFTVNTDLPDDMIVYSQYAKSVKYIGPKSANITIKK